MKWRQTQSLITNMFDLRKIKKANCTTLAPTQTPTTDLPTYRPACLPTALYTYLAAGLLTYRLTSLPPYLLTDQGLVVLALGSLLALAADTATPRHFARRAHSQFFVLPPSQIHGKCLDALQLRLHFDVLQHRQTASQYNLLDAYSR